MCPSIINGKENTMSSIRPAHILVGAATGERPVIKLDDHCPGFQDASVTNYNTGNSGSQEVVTKYTSLKAVINFWRQSPDGGGSVDRELNRGNINFNQTIRGINIDCGTGNPGAVGLWMQGAEGTTCQDVTIYAHDAFAGMYDMMGSGGAPTNLEIHGGKYGIYAYKMRPIPCVTGVRLYDQSVASFYVGDFAPVNFVGCEFRKDSGPVITYGNQYHPCQGNISMTDCKIELTGGGVSETMIRNGSDNKERIIYLENVYVKGAKTVIEHVVSGRKLSVEEPSQWNLIGEYQYDRVYNNPVKLIEGEYRMESTYYNGALTNSSIILDSIVILPTDLVDRHLWKVPFASFDYEADQVLNVMDFGAIPNDNMDDSDAINQAIDSAQRCNPVKRVFIPRGRWRILNTIEMKKDVTLFGVGRHLTILQPKSWSEAAETPVLRTEDDSLATCRLANMKIELYYSQYQIYAMNWRAGVNSMVKDVWVYWIGWSEQGVSDSNANLRRIQINGNGGGRWYNNLGMSGVGSRNTGSRHVLIEGTRQPLTFYGFHNQYLETLDGPMSEIINASNVTLYCLKAETKSERIDGFPEGKWSTSLRFRNSRNIKLIGMSGIAQTEPGKGLIEVENCDSVTVANMGTWLTGNEHPLDSWYLLLDKDEVKGINVVQKVLGLYKGRQSTLCVACRTPVVNAGADRQVQLPKDTVELMGSASVEEGEITDMQWEKLAGPELTLSGSDGSKLIISDLKGGVYTFRFAAQSDAGFTSHDELVLTVLAAPDTIRRNMNLIVIDGQPDEGWCGNLFTLDKMVKGFYQTECYASLLWDAGGLYVYAEIEDQYKINDSGQDWFDDDALELFIDADYSQGPEYVTGDVHIVYRLQESSIAEIIHDNTSGLEYVILEVADGYQVESFIPWTLMGVTPDSMARIGIEIRVRDDYDGLLVDAVQALFGKGTKDELFPEEFGTMVLGEGCPIVLNAPDAGLDKIRLYPNPVDDFLYVYTNNITFVPERYSIITRGGQTIRSDVIYNERLIDVNSLISGFYFIKLFNENDYVFTRFVKL
jgi:hypothetical protein